MGAGRESYTLTRMMDYTLHSYPFGDAAHHPGSLEAILARAASLGMRDVELMSASVPAYRKLARPPLPVAALHAVPGMFDTADDPRPLLAQVDCPHLVCSGPMQWHKRSRDDWQRTAEALNIAGSALAAEGRRLLYHNHDFEFHDLDSSGPATAWDLLLSELDPAACGICLDVGWAVLEDRELSALIRESRQHLAAVHLRDFRGREPCPLGDGDIDQRTILDVLAGTTLAYVAIEQDPPAPDGDALADFESSLAHLHSIHSQV